MAVLVVDRPVRNVRHVRYFASASNSGFPRNVARPGQAAASRAVQCCGSVSFIASLIAAMAGSFSPAMLYTRAIV
jgi:hypothetical protein